LSTEILRVTGPLDEQTTVGLYRTVAEVVASGGAIGWPEPPSRREFDTWLAGVVGAIMGAEAAAFLALGPEGADEEVSVLGFGYWRRYPRPTLRVNADLEKVFVTSSARGAGLGRELVQELVESARVAGVETLTLDARGDNTDAIRLYEQFGFVEYGRLPRFVAFGADRYDQVLLRLVLSS
jgi:ribosomal protein S18 acetylase RimI-like enzyme